MPAAFPAVTAGGLGLAAFTGTQFIVGDRGCLPAINTLQSLQTTIAPLNVAATVTFTPQGVLSDYGNWATLLCSTSGTCCSKNNCNSGGRIQINLASAFLSTAFMFIGLMNF